MTDNKKPVNVPDKPREDNHTPNMDKDRPGSSPEHPADADYDYRPDYGTSGGGAENNPDLDNEPLQDDDGKKPAKPKATQ